MKEIVCWIIPTILVFIFIALLESAMIFEKREEEMLTLSSSHQSCEK